MVTEMITLKLENTFLKEIDNIVSSNGYQSRTEFIRNALREKIDEVKLKRAMLHLESLKGFSKRKTTDEELESIREKVSREFLKKFK